LSREADQGSGAVGRQWDEGEVARPAQIFGIVPAGLIEHHDRVLVPGQPAGEAFQEDVHRLGADNGHHQGEVLTRRGTDGGEQMHPGVALIAQAGSALPAPPPAMADAALLADPVDRLRRSTVLEPQRHTLVGMCLPRAVDRGKKPPF